MVVRPAMRDDVPMITEIYNDAVLHSTASWDLEPASLQDRLDWFGTKMARQWPVLVAEAQRRSFHAMVGGVSADNAGSIAFHERHGFVAVGRFREVGRKFDRWLDLVFMQRLLDEAQETPHDG
jgi:L-amino acid N-acyltransferase